jgi:photosystem II stability/assembly factor-like uncharacterized protein
MLTVFITLASASQSEAGINFWSKSDISGGDIDVIAIAPSDPDVMYAASGWVLYRSSDGGQTWIEGRHGGSFSDLQDLVVDPTEPGIVYANTVFELMKSTDWGATWEEVRGGLPGYLGTDSRLFMDTSLPPRLYVLTRTNGVWVTNDGGTSWSQIDAALPSTAKGFTVDPNDPSRLFVVTSLDTFMSENSGSDWQDIGDGGPSRFPVDLEVEPDGSGLLAVEFFGGFFGGELVEDGSTTVSWDSFDFADVADGFYSLQVEVSQNGTVFLRTYVSQCCPWWNGNLLYRVAEDRASWDVVFDTEEVSHFATIHDGGLGQDSLFVASTVSGVWKSPDGGESWAISNSGIQSIDATGVTFDPDSSSTAYLSARAQGLFRSVDSGASFESVPGGPVEPDCTSVAVVPDPGNPSAVYTTDSLDLYRVGTPGWDYLGHLVGWPASDIGGLRVDASDPNLLYAEAWCREGCSPRSVISAVTLDPATNQVLSVVDTLGLPDEGATRMVAVNTTPASVYTIMFPLVFSMRNDGSGTWVWEEATDGLPGFPGAYSLAASPGGSLPLYLGTWNDGIYRLDTPADEGGSWSPLGTAGLPTNEIIMSLAVDQQNTLYVGVNNVGVYCSDDGGASWRRLDAGLTRKGGPTLAINNAEPPTLIARADGAVYTLTVNREDDDLDGIPPAIEDGAPNGGDGNGDGQEDSSQNNVTSVAGTTGTYLTFVAPAGTQMADVTASEPPDGAPVVFPYGMFGFAVTDLEVGAEIEVVVHVDDDVLSIYDYYKFGPELGDFVPHWYLFNYDPVSNTGAEFDTETNQIILHFVDGQRGDSDLMANGMIAEPGGPAFVGIVVAVDIKPGSDDNPINLRSRGVTPVAVLTTDVFDATTVDPPTITFAGAFPLRWSWEDVDHDGDIDLSLKFKTRELDLTESSTEAVLVGQTQGGIAIWGSDGVLIVP